MNQELRNNDEIRVIDRSSLNIEFYPPQSDAYYRVYGWAGNELFMSLEALGKFYEEDEARGGIELLQTIDKKSGWVSVYGVGPMVYDPGSSARDREPYLSEELGQIYRAVLFGPSLKEVING